MNVRELEDHLRKVGQHAAPRRRGRPLTVLDERRDAEATPVVAEVTLVGCVFWILVAAFVAGDAAARDVETGMHPLIYTAPVRKASDL